MGICLCKGRTRENGARQITHRSLQPAWPPLGGGSAVPDTSIPPPLSSEILTVDFPILA